MGSFSGMTEDFDRVAFRRSAFRMSYASSADCSGGPDIHEQNKIFEIYNFWIIEGKNRK